MTDVYNANGSLVISYSLPPQEAVVVAYHQYSRNDFNTWDYDRQPHPEVIESPFGYICGDFWAKKS